MLWDRLAFIWRLLENSLNQPQRCQQHQYHAEYHEAYAAKFFRPIFHAAQPPACIVHSEMLLRQMDTEWNTGTSRNIRLYNPANHTNAAQSVQ